MVAFSKWSCIRRSITLLIKASAMKLLKGEGLPSFQESCYNTQEGFKNGLMQYKLADCGVDEEYIRFIILA